MLTHRFASASTVIATGVLLATATPTLAQQCATDGDRFRTHPRLRDLDLPPLGGDGRGGPLVTKTLLVSALTAGGSDGGPRLIARDKATGQIVGSIDLPSGALGTPMTYLHGGKQYVALTVGGEVPELIALALP